MNEILNVMEKQNINTIVDIESPYIINGIMVPRVTNILSAMLHEDYLMKWSNAIGLYQHKKYEDTLQDAADKGTYVHEAINDFLMTGNKLDPNTLLDATSEQRKAASNGFYSFLNWWESNKENIKLVSTEMELICPYFGGTCDLIIEYNGKRFLLDFKTAKQIGYKYFLQLAAYRHILERYYNTTIDGCGILLLDKNNIHTKEYILSLDIPENEAFMRQSEQTFLSLVYAYYNRLYTEKLYSEIF